LFFPWYGGGFWGGKWGEGLFLGGTEWGTGKFHFFTANSENIDKIWKFSPNSKKPKIGQNKK